MAPLTVAASVAGWAALLAAGYALAQSTSVHATTATPGAGPRGDTVLVPAGTFQMGSPDGEGESNERPRHTVTVAAFLLDRTEVTVAGYRRCVTAGSCSLPGTRGECNGGLRHRDRHPINCVDWTQADAYVRGAHTVFQCDVNDGAGGSVAFDVGPQRTLRSLGPTHSGLLLSADGSVAAYRGTCPDATTHRIGQGGWSTRACVIPLGAAGPPRELPTGGELRAVTPQGLVVDVHSPSPHEPRRLLFIPMNGGPSREAFRFEVGRTVAEEQPTETGDGLLYWRMVPGDGASPDETRSQPEATLVGTARARFEARPLPSGANALGFLDAQRGIAADLANMRIWYTTDTGRTWTPASVPEAAHDVVRQGMPTVDCDASKCVVGNTLRVVWREHGSASPFTLLASDTFTAPPLPRATPGLVMTCTGPATETPRPRLPALFTAHDGNHFTSDDEHDGVLADIAVRAGSHGTDHWQFVWHGSDARGAFSSATRLVTLPRIAGANTELVDAGSHGPQWGVALIGATRDSAVFLRCTPGNTTPLVCELLRGEAGRGIQSLGSHDPNAALSEPGDGFLGFLDFTRETVRLVRTVNLAAQLETHDAHGHHATSEPIPSDSGEHVMWPVVRVHGTWGLAGERLEPPTPAWFFPFGGGRGLPTLLVPLTPRTACRVPASSDATVAIDATLVSVTGSGGLTLPPFRSDVVEVTGDGTCLRSVTVRDATATAILSAQPDGSLAGTLISAHGQRALRCTPQPVPTP